MSVLTNQCQAVWSWQTWAALIQTCGLAHWAGWRRKPLMSRGGREEGERQSARRCRSCRRWRRRGGRCRRTAWGGASRAAPWRTTPRWSSRPPAARPSSAPWSAGPSSPRAGRGKTSGCSSTRRPSRPSSSVSISAYYAGLSLLQCYYWLHSPCLAKTCFNMLLFRSC
jgi:hypothetical protein